MRLAASWDMLADGWRIADNKCSITAYFVGSNSQIWMRSSWIKYYKLQPQAEKKTKKTIGLAASEILWIKIAVQDRSGNKKKKVKKQLQIWQWCMFDISLRTASFILAQEICPFFFLPFLCLHSTTHCYFHDKGLFLFIESHFLQWPKHNVELFPRKCWLSNQTCRTCGWGDFTKIFA